MYLFCCNNFVTELAQLELYYVKGNQWIGARLDTLVRSSSLVQYTYVCMLWPVAPFTNMD